MEISGLFGFQMKVSQRVNNCGYWPCLSLARIRTVRSVWISQLWQSLELIFEGQDMLLVGKQPFHNVMSRLIFRLILSENEKGFEEESSWPNPFRSLMVIDSMWFIAVVIISSIVVVGRVKRFNTHTTLFHENFLSHFQEISGVLSIEKLWGNSHGYAHVRSQLIIGVAIFWLIDILVNTSSVYQSLVNIVIFVSFFINRNPEARFKVLFNFCGPVFVS